MKNFLLIALCLLILFFTSSLSAQRVGIGTDSPDNSALLELNSVEKGLLIPRMSATDRQNIADPAKGLMVYDTTNKAFYYFMGNGWLELLAGSVDKIADADGDTKIQVEETPDEDSIHFDLAGTRNFTMAPGGKLGIVNTGRSVFIGHHAGDNDDLTNNKNIFIGENAGQQNVTGVSNVVVGSDALSLSNIASYNTAIGWLSLGNLDHGTNSTALGSTALRDNIDGSSNVAVGSQAIVTNLHGSRNVAIGAAAGQTNQGSGNVFLGHNAGKIETGSNLLYIDNSDTLSPLIYGDFSANLVRIGGTLNVNNAYAFPLSDGSAQQVLQTDGSGILSWGDKNMDTDNQTIDTLQMNGSVLEVSLEDDGQPVQTLDLASINTDHQTIDTLQLNGSVLELSLEDDGLPVQTLDLSSLNSVQSVITDADGDTRIQVEKFPDEDQIRFDIAGQEVMKLDNAGNAYFQGITHTSLYLNAPDTTYGASAIFTGSGTTYNLGTPDGLDRFRLWNSQTGEILSALPTGKIGIGISGPEEKLHVQGRIIATDTTRAGLILKTSDNTRDMGLAFRNSGGNYTWSIYRTDTGGNSADLVFAGGNQSGDPALLTERMRISDEGNVGIGTISPDEKLQVDGHIRMVDGSEGFGKMMLSDSNGVASWVDPNSAIPLPDTANPVPIKYHQRYLMVYPVDNAANIDWQMAVDTCSALVAFGHDDWFLPSLEQLNAMYKQSYLITGLSETGLVKYWSASENGINDAYTQRLDYGGPDPDIKTDMANHHCRCVRQD